MLLKILATILKPLALVVLIPFVFFFLLLKSVATWANHRFSLVGDKYFFERDQFTWVDDVEACTQGIQQELVQVLSHKSDLPNFQDVLQAQARLTQDNKWKTFVFYLYGEQVKENCQTCPQTVAALQKIPGIKSAFFSILDSRKHVPPHEGPYNGVLRYHLGLKIPDEQACRIRVGNELGYWNEGGSLLFDDSYEHEAWNDSDSERVVLFVDFERPLPGWAAALNRLVIYMASKLPPVQKGIKIAGKWNKQLAVN